MPEIFFTADTHFGHGRILEIAPATRKFTSADEMDDTIVERWNAKVGKNDIVYHLGDFCWARYAHEVESYLSRLKGSTHLILGNHDHRPTRKAKGFASIEHYREIKVNDQKIILFHYAMRTWNGSFHKEGRLPSWMLYGHSHGTLMRNWQVKSFDVGVDVWNFTPLSYDEIEEQMKLHKAKPTDRFSAEIGSQVLLLEDSEIPETSPPHPLPEHS